MNAIETAYAGCLFRSRLEARWAVFFDSLKIEWEYEKEGYEVRELGCCCELRPPVGECPEHADWVTRYLPDFWLPETETWVEVKGSDEALRADAEKLETMLDWSSPLPGIQDSGDPRQDEGWCKARGLLILGPIPNDGWGVILHPLIRHCEGLVRHHAYFGGDGRPHSVEPNELLGLFARGLDESFFKPNQWSVSAQRLPTHFWWNTIKAAYSAARSARFEFGETPVKA